MLCGSDDFIERAAVWRTRYGGRLVSTTMITVDMASSMRECLRSDTFQKSFDVLCAVAEGVNRLDEPRLRFDPAVPQSAMTHVCVRCPGSPAKGERPEALLAAAEALRAQTGIRLFGGLQSKFSTGGGAYGSKTTGPPKGSVNIGKEGMADDEYSFEWVVPGVFRSLPAAEVAEHVVEAWGQFFALLDEQQSASAAGSRPAMAKI